MSKPQSFSVMFFIAFFMLCPAFLTTTPPTSSFAQQSPSPSSCSSYRFSNKKQFSSCNDLPVLDASIHWSYDHDSHVVDLAFRHTGVKERRWVAWGVNPTSQGMVGTQAFIAYPKTDGSVAAYTSPIMSYGTMLAPGNLSFPVSDVSATYADNEIVLFAKFGLSGNTSVINHIWQEGPLVGDTLMMHSIAPSSPNLRSFGQLDLLSGRVASNKVPGGSLTTTLKYVHGGLNTISWGILMPAGAIIARNFKSADPLWFKLHRSIQGMGLLVGLAGFSTGIFLGYKSPGIQFTAHKIIGISLSCMAILQVGVALFARPSKDSKNRPYFNWFHIILGYSTIALSIANIFEGLRILQGSRVLFYLYIAVLSVLGCSAVLSEIWRRRYASRKASDSMDNNPTRDDHKSMEEV